MHSIRYEKRRGFQPPWYTVQIVTCAACGRVTTWRPSGWIGVRRTPAGHLVGITPQFPGRCAHCDDRRIAEMNGGQK